MSLSVQVSWFNCDDKARNNCVCPGLSISIPNFTRTIAKMVSTWTGRIWQVNSSSSNIGNTLFEEDLIKQKAEIEKMKNDPEIKFFLEQFPGSKIHSITEINETSDEKKPTLDKDQEKEKKNG